MLLLIYFAVTEPMSSFHESLPLDLDLAKISSSGQPSSDFMNNAESLPPDLNASAKNSMTLSVTSREEFCSVSEVEVVAPTWPLRLMVSSTTASAAAGSNSSSIEKAMTTQLSKDDVDGMYFVRCMQID